MNKKRELRVVYIITIISWIITIFLLLIILGIIKLPDNNLLLSPETENQVNIKVIVSFSVLLLISLIGNIAIRIIKRKEEKGFEIEDKKSLKKDQSYSSFSIFKNSV